MTRECRGDQTMEFLRCPNRCNNVPIIVLSALRLETGVWAHISGPGGLQAKISFQARVVAMRHLIQIDSSKCCLLDQIKLEAEETFSYQSRWWRLDFCGSAECAGEVGEVGIRALGVDDVCGPSTSCHECAFRPIFGSIWYLACYTVW